MAFLYRAFTTREETISFGLTTGFDRGSPKRTSSWNFEGGSPVDRHPENPCTRPESP